MVGFTFEVGFVGMGAFFPDDSKSFTETGQFRFNTDEAIQLLRNDPNTTDTYDQLNQIEQAVVDKLTSEEFSVEVSGATIIGDSKDYVTITFPEHTFDDIVGTGTSYTVEGQTVELPVAGLCVMCFSCQIIG